MPRGLTPEQKLYAREVFRDLEAKFPNQRELGEKLGIDQSRVSAIRIHGTTSMQTLVSAAALAGRASDEILRKTGMSIGSPTRQGAPTSDPFIGTFLLQIGELPGLRKWLTEHPQAVRVSEVCRGIELYEKAPNLTRSDGEPHQGWAAFFDDVRADRVSVLGEELEDIAELAAVEQRQNRGMKKTVQAAPAKITKRNKKDGDDV